MEYSRSNTTQISITNDQAHIIGKEIGYEIARLLATIIHRDPGLLDRYIKLYAQEIARHDIPDHK